MLLNPHRYATGSGGATAVSDFNGLANTIASFDLTAENLEDATSISSLTDQSGNGHTLTQVTGSKQPTAQTVSGMKIMSFDPGASQSIGNNAVSGGTVPITVIALAKSNDPDTTDRRIFNAATDRFIIRTASGLWDIYNGGSAGVSGGADDAAWHTFVAVFRTTSASDLYVDGGSANTGSSGSSTAFSRIILGRRDASEALFWDGDMNFVGVYGGNLVSDDLSLLNALGQQLADRAGITWTNIT